MHHDRRLHQLMLQEEMREWLRGPAASQWPSVSDDEDSDATEDAFITAGSMLVQAAGSPADSVSSLHGDLDASEAGIHFRCAPAAALALCAASGLLHAPSLAFDLRAQDSVLSSA